MNENKFIRVQDFLTGKGMLIRVPCIERVWEADVKGVICRVVKLSDGTTEYVTNTLESIAYELSNI